MIEHLLDAESLALIALVLGEGEPTEQWPEENACSLAEPLYLTREDQHA